MPTDVAPKGFSNCDPLRLTSVAAGVQTKVLQRRLRYADVKTTLAIYEHSSSAQGVEAAVAIELQISGLQQICNSKGDGESRWSTT